MFTSRCRGFDVMKSGYAFERLEKLEGYCELGGPSDILFMAPSGTFKLFVE